MEVICFSETSIGCQRITRRYIPEDRTLRNHRCENLNLYWFSNYVLVYSLNLYSQIFFVHRYLVCVCMFLSRQQNAGQNHEIKIANSSFENVAHLNIWERHKEIKRGLNSGNACYHSVQNLLSSRLLSKNVKIGRYKIIILPVVKYGCEI
jgi:hypothetical protein